MVRLILALLYCVVFSANANARQMHKDCNLPGPNSMTCVAPYASTPEQARVTRGRYIRNELGFGGPVDASTPRRRVIKRTVRAPKARPAASIARTISGIVAPLAAKVAEIQSVCGSRVVSAVRHTYVAGTRKLSLHASGQAVDMAGNPSCIYLLLRGWPGGYSLDYGRVAHVHISYGGREHGIRFVHGGHHKRHARRSHHNRYARAGW